MDWEPVDMRNLRDWVVGEQKGGVLRKITGKCGFTESNRSLMQGKMLGVYKDGPS